MTKCLVLGGGHSDGRCDPMSVQFLFSTKSEQIVWRTAMQGIVGHGQTYHLSSGTESKGYQNYRILSFRRSVLPYRTIGNPITAI